MKLFKIHSMREKFQVNKWHVFLQKKSMVMVISPPPPSAITKSHCILQTIKILLFLERIFVSYICAKQDPLF